MLAVQLLLYVTCFLFLVNVVVAKTDDEEWNDFKKSYNKKYKTNEEHDYRRGVWQKTLNEIKKHNADSSQTYKLGINQFTDLTQDEYSKAVLGGRKNKMFQQQQQQQQQHQVDNVDNRQHSQKDGRSRHKLKCNCRLKPNKANRDNYYDAMATLPDSVDWRAKGYVTPVKDQGYCASCWAFSTTGALEGQLFKATGKLVSLSEQNLVDCSGAYNNRGCGGGWPVNAFEYVRDNGVTNQQSYPYEQLVNTTDRTCRVAGKQMVARCTDYEEVLPLDPRDELTLKKAVATVGPISAVLFANLPSFKSYSSGIYNDLSCITPVSRNHCVLVVGYNSVTVDGRKYDYWIVKNSWSTSWGIGGYILIERNNSNMCGIASVATYPVGVAGI